MKKNLALFITILVIGLSSCKKDDNSGPSTKPVRYVTEKDTFNTDVVWYADTIYCIQNRTQIKGTLTVRPGTIVKLDKLASINADDIVAVGTEAEPIIFTSIYDDEHGGDIDGDNGVITPDEGTWSSIGSITNYSGRFEHCEFYYGGCLFMLPAIKGTVKNCIFAHNKGMLLEAIFLDYALLIYNIPSPTVSYTFECSNNIFYDNVKPIGFLNPYSMDSTNTFSFEGKGNKMNGIFFFHKMNNFNKQVYLQETEVPYIINTDLKIIDGGKIEFADGAVVKCDQDVTITIDGGHLNSENHEVIYTSIKDDENGGDSNGDGNATTPHDGDWKGIYNNNSIILLNRWLSGSNILYDEPHNIVINP